MESVIAISLLDVTMVVLVAGLLVLALTFVLRGISLVVRHFRRSGEGSEDARRAVLEVAKERVFENLRDLEMDHAMRKISDGDYEMLRAQSETEAVKVIREIDGLEERGIHRRHMWILLAGLGCCLSLSTPADVFAQSMPPGHPPVGAPPSAPGVESTHEFIVSVLKTTKDGSLEVFGDAPVLLEIMETQPGPMAEEKIQETRMIRTGSRGSKTVQIPMSTGNSVRAYVPYGDAVFATSWTPGDRKGRPDVLPIFVYETTKVWDNLSFEIFVVLHQSQWRDREENLFVAEGQLSVLVAITIRNDGVEAVDLRDPNQPFFLPLVAPVVGERVLTRGWWPDAAGRHIHPKGNPLYEELSIEEGGIVYRGLVLPGLQTKVEFSYPLDVVAADMELGVVSENVPIELLKVMLQLRDDVSGDIRFGHPSHLISQREESEDGLTRKVFVVEGRIAPGEPVFMTVTHLPVQGEYTRRASAWVVFFALLAFVIALLRARAPRQSDRGRHSGV